MTQPIAPKGASALALSGNPATAVRDKAGVAAAPEPVRSKRGGADSIHISVAARHQLAISVSAQGSSVHTVNVNSVQAGQSDAIQDGRGDNPSAADKAETLLRDMRAAFFTSEGDDGFNPRLDFNKDGRINVEDMAMVRRKLGDAMGQGPVTVVADPLPADDAGPVMEMNPAQTQATASNATTTLDALRAAFYTRTGEDGFNASVDFNKDGVIDARDLGLAKRGMADDTQPVAPSVTDTDPASDMEQTLTDLRAAFFSRAGDDNYNAAVDFNNDGIVNVRDLAMARAGSGAPDDSEVTQPVAPQAPQTDNFGVRARTLVQQLREAFFSSRDDASFNSALDANGDGRINVADLIAARDRLRDDSA